MKRLIYASLSTSMILTSITSQATSIQYTTRNEYGGQSTSKISVLSESNGIYLVEITGGMPRLSTTNSVYIYTSFGPTIEQPDTVLGYAVYHNPDLYVYATSTINIQKAYFPSYELYTFNFEPDSGFTLTTGYIHSPSTGTPVQYVLDFPSTTVYELIEQS